ncbi:MAG TPA: hydrogenase [Anaeromyxobacteraceae bacterium]|nr:hydrogenase [Anaeromyxobacteraceae bacterium]
MSGASTFRAAVAALPTEPKAFFDAAKARLAGGARPVTFWGQPADDPAELTLTLVLEEAGRLDALRTAVPRDRGFHALTRAHPALHVFEREIFEQHGVKPHDHPWLKPVRSPGAGPAGMLRYPLYAVEGKEVHEVAVGPIHAGVIEPGHFRFMCLGEVVHHLEIQLGWQHRGAAALLLRRDPRSLAPLVETLAGDASVAHAWAWADAVEALAGLAASPELELWRGVGLELERIAMHLSGLAGLANDVAFLQGSAGYGRLRTTVINASMLACGSRLGRGWVRACELRLPSDRPLLEPLRAALALLERDVALVDDRFAASASVRARLDGVGALRREQALELGLVGPAARASGVALDARHGLPGALYARLPVEPVVEATGDCWARARVRMREIGASIGWIRAALDALGEPAPFATPVGPLAPSTLAVAVRESWRGEVVHALETDAAGRLRHYQAQDPSLRNWHGLALAVRENEISDFPICNKSFDLSYCGSDL